MKQKREKKIALVTGAASGLGFALSNLLSSESFHVIGVSKNLQGLEDLKKSLLKNSNSSFDLIAELFPPFKLLASIDLT